MPQDTGSASDDLIICRCEGVTLGQIKEAVRQRGAGTINQTKKLTRAGMGLCQGKTCARTLGLIVETEAGSVSEIEAYRSRPPVRPVSLACLAGWADDFAEPSGPVSVVMLRAPEEDDAT